MSKTTVLSPEFRVSYPKVFKPEKNDLNGQMEFSLVCLFPLGADLSVLKAAAKAAVIEKWGENENDWPKNLRLPFRDQADREKTDPATGDKFMPDGYVKGAFFMNPKSQQRPGIVDASLQDIIDETDFYAGCYARAQIRFKAYDQKGNRGVGAYLQHIQKLRDGESFGSRTTAASAFGAPAGAGQSSATGAGMFD